VLRDGVRLGRIEDPLAPKPLLVCAQQFVCSLS
jgi:hypothetical protein